MLQRLAFYSMLQLCAFLSPIPFGFFAELAELQGTRSVALQGRCLSRHSQIM